MRKSNQPKSLAGALLLSLGSLMSPLASYADTICSDVGTHLAISHGWDVSGTGSEARA